jgi:hypothetical protein
MLRISKMAALLSFHQEEDLVLRLGGGRDPDHDLVHALDHDRVADFELDVHRRRLRLQEDLGRVRHFERRVLEVDALKLEHRGVAGGGGRVRHCSSLR